LIDLDVVSAAFAAPPVRAADLQPEFLRHLSRNSVLHGKNICESGVKAVGPERHATSDFDDLHTDAYPLPDVLQRAVQHQVNPQLAPGERRIFADLRVFQNCCRGAHNEPAVSAQAGDDRVSDARPEQAGGLIHPEQLKRQYSQRCRGSDSPWAVVGLGEAGRVHPAGGLRHRGDETVATTGDSGDIGRLAVAVTQRLSEHEDALRQVTLFHNGVGPEHVHQNVALH